jgi:hypothetical protein
MRTSLLIDWLAHSLTLQALILSLPLLHPAGYVHLAHFPMAPFRLRRGLPVHSIRAVVDLVSLRPEIILAH